MILLPLLLIFVGWAVAAGLAAWLGPRTDYSLPAVMAALAFGTGCSVLAVVIS